MRRRRWRQPLCSRAGLAPALARFTENRIDGSLGLDVDRRCPKGRVVPLRLRRTPEKSRELARAMLAGYFAV